MLATSSSREVEASGKAWNSTPRLRSWQLWAVLAVAQQEEVLIAHAETLQGPERSSLSWFQYRQMACRSSRGSSQSWTHLNALHFSITLQAAVVHVQQLQGLLFAIQDAHIPLHLPPLSLFEGPLGEHSHALGPWRLNDRQLLFQHVHGQQLIALAPLQPRGATLGGAYQGAAHSQQVAASQLPHQSSSCHVNGSITVKNDQE